MQEPAGAASAGKTGAGGRWGKRQAENGSVNFFSKDSNFFHRAGRERQEGIGNLLAVLNICKRHCALLLIMSCLVVAYEQ